MHVVPLRLAFAALAAATLSFTAPALAHRGPATLEIVDRHDNTVLPVYEKDGRRYVVGTPGHEYALRIRNMTGRRILAVTSVDGVNVVTGATASPQQSGYVIDPWRTAEIPGWRKSVDETAAFYFTEHDASYAARTGRPLDVGVIGVAVFNERPVPVAAPKLPDEPRLMSSQRPVARADAAGESAPAAGSAAPAAPAAKLGTGHGRREDNRVTMVAFERETATPAQLIEVQYDRRENLVAIGVLPPPTVAERRPRPFPAASFVPDPPGR